MIKKLSSLLTNIISRSKPIDEDEMRIYEYCIHIILKRCLFVILIILFGVITKRISVSLLFLLTFIPLRSFCGGMHASTPTVCSVLSYGISLAVIFFSPLIGKNIPFIFLVCIFILFCISILIFAPVDTRNKRLNPKQKCSLKNKCYILMFFIVAEFVIFSIFRAKTYYMTVTLCVIICSISVVIGFLQNRRIQNEI